MNMPEQKKQFVVRNVRINVELDEIVLAIANYEDRTISKMIQILLNNAVDSYLQDNFCKGFGTRLSHINSSLYDKIANICDDNGPRYL